jgi:MoaA/NifB/PqqE/SkfB family radical SAM enzyme
MKKAVKIAKVLSDIYSKDGVSGVIRKIGKKLGITGYQVPSKLDMVVVEITTHCNLSCAGCIRTINRKEKNWKNKHINLNDYKKIIEHVSPAVLFMPQGIGETTMHSDIYEIIKIASDSSKFDRIEINSNLLVTSIEIYAKLFEAGLTGLSISVDSLDENTVKLVREGTDVNLLFNRLGEIVERFRNKISIRITVSKWNIDNLPSLLAKLNEIGPINVFLQPFFNMGKKDGVLDVDQADNLINTLTVFQKRYTRLTIKTEQFKASTSVCVSPWSAPAIRVDGVVKPCCMVLYEDEMSFGNAFEEPFYKIWSSKKVELFRKSFLKRSPKCCANCPYYQMRY